MNITAETLEALERIDENTLQSLWWLKVVACLCGLVGGGWSFYQVWIVSRSTRVLTFGSFIILGAAGDAEAQVGTWNFQTTSGQPASMSILPDGTGTVNYNPPVTFNWQKNETLTINGTNGWSMSVEVVGVPSVDETSEIWLGTFTNGGSSGVPNICQIYRNVNGSWLYCYETIEDLGLDSVPYGCSIGSCVVELEDYAWDSNGGNFYWELSLQVSYSWGDDATLRANMISSGCGSGTGAGSGGTGGTSSPPRPDGGGTRTDSNNVFDCDTDINGNGLADVVEFECLECPGAGSLGTPLLEDTDGDGYTNLHEIRSGSEPCYPNSVPDSGEQLDGDTDWDNDGQSDHVQFPCLSGQWSQQWNDFASENGDEDNDGYGNRWEIEQGYDPCDANSRPALGGVAPGGHNDQDGDGSDNPISVDDATIEMGQVSLGTNVGTYTGNIDLGTIGNITTGPVFNMALPVLAEQTSAPVWAYTINVFGEDFVWNVYPEENTHPEWQAAIFTARMLFRGFWVIVLSWQFFGLVKDLLGK